MVNSAGIISTIAGPQPGYNGEGIASTGAALGGPVALATDAQGNLYVNESFTQRIRKFTKVSGPIPPKRRAVLWAYPGFVDGLVFESGESRLSSFEVER